MNEGTYLIAKDAVYNSTCLSSYLSKTNLKTVKTIKAPDCGLGLKNTMDLQFHFLHNTDKASLLLFCAAP